MPTPKLTDEEIKSKTFGWLTPIEPIYKDGRKMWRCRCKCGRTIERYQWYLTGEQREFSCGCVNKQKGEKCRQWKGFGDVGGLYMSCMKRHARQLGVIFDITAQDAWELFIKQNGKCNLTGLPIQLSKSKKTREDRVKQTASLDRIDSTKGYTKDNIQWILKSVNIMKNKYNQDYFVEICCRVANLHQAKEAQLTQSA